MWITSRASSSGATRASISACLGARFRPFSQSLEACPFLELQDHVSGVVRAEVTINPADVAVVETRERFRLLDEAVEAPLVVSRCVARHGYCTLVVAARREIGRKIFLDRNGTRQSILIGEIRNSKPAHAEDAVDPEIADEFGAARERHDVGHRSSRSGATASVRGLKHIDVRRHPTLAPDEHVFPCSGITRTNVAKNCGRSVRGALHVDWDHTNKGALRRAESARMTFLSLQRLTKRFGDHAAVDDLTLDVAKGEFVSLLGPSGCGKTTTLQMIAGFVTPSSGAITLDGRDLLAIHPRNRRLGVVFQSYALFPHMTVAENVGFGLDMLAVQRSEREKRVADTLRLVGLDGFGMRYPRRMSGGQQQRVALSRALVIRPQILLLDEPLSNLDAKLREEMQIELRHIQRASGATTILVTHDQAEAMALSDRIVVMNKGRVEQIAAPHEAYARPATPFVAGFLGKMNVMAGTHADGRLTIGESTWNVAEPLASRIEATIRPERIGFAIGEEAGLGRKSENAHFPGQSLAVPDRLRGRAHHGRAAEHRHPGSSRGRCGAAQMVGCRHDPAGDAMSAEGSSRANAGLLLIAPSVLLFIGIVLVPLLMTAVLSFNEWGQYTGIQPVLTLKNWQEVLSDGYYGEVFLRTLRIAVAATLITAVIGTPEAYIIHRMRNPWKGICLLVILGPLLISVVARTLGWALLFGGNSGVVNLALMNLGVIKEPLPFMFTEIGVVVALAHVLTPFMVLSVWASLQKLDPAIENAATSLGAGMPTIVRRIILPQIVPGLLSGAIIVFALAASAFASPAIVGGRRLKVAATLAYDEFLNTLNWPLGAVVAVLLLVGLMAIVTAANRFVERRYAEVFR